MDQEAKVKENRLRRMADRQGLRLSKSRTRDPHGMDFGMYALIDHQTGGATHPPLAGRWVHTLTLEEVEEYLSKD